jgi:hypothetical protein
MQISFKKGPPKEIPNLKNSLGLLELKRNDLAKAEILFKSALQLSLEIKFEYGQKKALYNLGLLAQAKNDTLTARLYFSNSYLLDLLRNDYYGMSLNQLALTTLLNNKDMYLIQKATRIVNQWALNEDDALVVLNDFIKANSDLINHYYDLPHLALEKEILFKLESFACDYLFANQLSYL